jgi:hypothetical protein
MRRPHMKKFKAKLYYNMVEEVELEAENEEDAREKAFGMGGEGKTHTFYDFMEVEEYE